MSFYGLDNSIEANQELVKQNHELRKKLIRIEAESKKERSALLQQFEELKCKMADFDQKETFFKKSQASLNELICNLAPVKEKNSLLFDDMDKSTLSNRLTLKHKKTEDLDLKEDPKELDTSCCMGKKVHSEIQDLGKYGQFSEQPAFSDSDRRGSEEMVSSQIPCMQKMPFSNTSPVKSQETIRAHNKDIHQRRIPIVSPHNISPEFKINLSGSNNQQKNDLKPECIDSEIRHLKLGMGRASSHVIQSSGFFEGERVTRPSNGYTSNKKNVEEATDQSFTPISMLKAIANKSREDREFASQAKTNTNIMDTPLNKTGKSSIAKVLAENPFRMNVKKRPQKVLYNNNPVPAPKTLSSKSRQGSVSLRPASVREAEGGLAREPAHTLSINKINIDFSKGKVGIRLEPNGLINHSRSNMKQKRVKTYEESEGDISKGILTASSIHSKRNIKKDSSNRSVLLKSLRSRIESESSRSYIKTPSRRRDVEGASKQEMLISRDTPTFMGTFHKKDKTINIDDCTSSSSHHKQASTLKKLVPIMHNNHMKSRNNTPHLTLKLKHVI